LAQLGALMQAFLLVGAGGAIGAMGRYGFGVMLGRVWHGGFPLATLGVNVIGSLIMGLLVGLLARYTPEWQAEARAFAAVGILGGFTTFSAFSLDAITLIERGQLMAALGYILVSVIASILAVYIGLMLVRGAV
jgi:CrcB protein